MKTTGLKLLALLSMVAVPALAEETVPEKAKDATKDAVREVKKAGHRTSEALCTGTKAECERRKAGHRVTEVKDAAKDKVEETKDKLDSN